MKNTFCCLVQNRLGALDRVLGALTHRGFVPEQLVSTVDPESRCLQIILTFECAEERTVEKLFKFLKNQVFVIEVERVRVPKPEREVLDPPKGKDFAGLPFPTPIKVASLFSAPAERRLSHVNHA